MKQLTLFFMLFVFYIPFPTQAQDGIPDNCEYNPSMAYQFVRYEPQNRLLMLVDWNTGDDIRTIADNLNDTIILGWSLDCTYLAGAVSNDTGRDSIVWNVNTGEQMGVVPDAQQQTHRITWGPDNYLVVETRKGAILWHVPTYQQMTLTDYYDPINVRNFSRVRWDATYGQLIANLSGGGRVVYDLQTGQEVPQVAQQSDALAGESDNRAIIGGAQYDCRRSTFYGISDLAIKYNPNINQIYIELYNDDLPEETLVVLEENPELSWFKRRGWSPDCQYVVASLGVVGQDASDTYVWNVSTGERLGIILDARSIEHPLTWHPTQPILLVETRNGAILWYLPTNQQYQLDTGARTPLVGRSDIQNFTQVGWANNLLFIVPVNAPNSIQVYDATIGQLTQTISLETDIRYITVSPLGNYVLLCCSANDNFGLWNRITNVTVELQLQDRKSRQFSPNEQYLLSTTRGGLVIWDINAINPDGSPNRVIADETIRYGSKFIDDATFDTGASLINVSSGTIISRDSVGNIHTNRNDITGESGYRAYWKTNCSRTIVKKWQNGKIRPLNNYTIYEGDEPLYTIQARYLRWSPNCKWLYGEVPYFEFLDTIPPVDDTFRERDSEYAVFWDGDTGDVINSFYNPFKVNSYAGISWSPDGNYVIVKTTEGSYLYLPAMGTSYFLVMPDERDVFRARYSTYWDFERGQVFVTGRTAIYAFDLATGEWRFTFTARPDKSRCYYWGCILNIPSSDYLVVGDIFNFTVWNLNTYEGYWLDFGDLTDIRIQPYYFRFSPSGRFVIKRFLNTLYVWDLQTISDNESPTLPYEVRLNYRLNYDGLIFVDDSTVEIQVTNGGNYTLSLLQ